MDFWVVVQMGERLYATVHESWEEASSDIEGQVEEGYLVIVTHDLEYAAGRMAVDLGEIQVVDLEEGH